MASSPARPARSAYSRSGITRMSQGPTENLSIATARPRASSRTGRGRRPATTNTSRATPAATSITSARPPAIQLRAITATIWAPGTLWFSTPTTTAGRSLATSARRRNSGFARTSQPTRRTARSRSGTTPSFTSGTTHGNAPWAKPFWDDLYAQGADVVLSAHEHNYERFAPQTPAGEPDPQFGIREFVVGTGGESHYADYNAIRPNSEVRDNKTYGVIRLVLHPDGYDWDFLPAYRGDTFQDSGSGACHGAPKS